VDIGDGGSGVQRILLVDDDIALTDMIREFLELEGFQVEAVHDGGACFQCDLENTDLIVLDVMLPVLSGFEVLKKLRQTSSLPVIMLTARSDDIDRIIGLEIGADDYVPKPVNARELVARIRAVLRRTAPPAVEVARDLSVGEIRVDIASRNAWVNEQRVDLTTAEFNLLEYLLRNAGRAVSRDELSSAAFGRQFSSGGDRNVDTLVSKLRRKLGVADSSEERIKTIRNIGYIFALPSAGSGPHLE